ncbi:MAG: deoxyribodipyrimidine photolyase [Vicinamibacterales bacterium]
MIASRRPHYNFALDRAVEWCVRLGRPLVVLEALRVDYPFASDRLHRFVIDGMRDNAAAFSGSNALYFPYVEPRPGAARGLLRHLAREACVVVTDDYPCFFLPAAVESAGTQVGVRLEAVDSNGLLPLSVLPQAYPAAVHHRRFMQRVFREHVVAFPERAPLDRLPSLRASLPAGTVEAWSPASRELLAGSPSELASLPLDHDVHSVSLVGGCRAGSAALGDFVERRLSVYHDAHNHPDDHGTSRLSPYLHFGHVSPHQVFDAVMRQERWTVGRLAARPSGAREGWWGVGPGAEAFLDQLVVWRELGFAACAKHPDDYDRFEGLPGWAQETLIRHAADERPVLYDLGTLERAETHDPIWNAAQREMLRDGWMHNYMRMLWGKKILEWSPTPQEALSRMKALMDRWALDARDPNSYTGYLWTLGKYDRPWPERPIFGTVRYMSSDSAARKLRIKAYVASAQPGLF